MFKKLFLVSSFLFGSVLIGNTDSGTVRPDNYLGPIGPTYFTGTSVTGGTSSVTGVGRTQNCLVGFSVVSSAVSNVAIIDGTLATGTTMWYYPSLAANTFFNKDMTVETSLCASMGNTLTINISSGTYNGSYHGYSRGTR